MHRVPVRRDAGVLCTEWRPFPRTRFSCTGDIWASCAPSSRALGERVAVHQGEGAAVHRGVGVPCSGAVVWCSGAVAARSLSPHRRRVQPGGAPAARY